VIVDLERARTASSICCSTVPLQRGRPLRERQRGRRPDGYLDLLYSSLGNWREITGDFTTNDYLREIYSIDVAPNGQYLALGKVNGPIYILPLDASGLPILTNRVTLNAASAGPTRDVAFDAAGNLYMVNNNIELLRAYSPGGRWVATTGSDGTFTVTNPRSPSPSLRSARADK